MGEKSVAERIELAEKKVAFIDGHGRKRAAALLFLGSVFGLLGFCFAFVTGFMKFHAASNDFPSGNGYFPSTVSEMVSNPKDPAGKAFFGFEFTGALFIFLSWYPWELRNVYIGDDDTPCCGVSWIMFRQFIPAPGMMLVATVTTTPMQTATIRDQFTIFIHLCGAMMMFVGYFCCEAKTLGAFKFSPPSVETHIEEDERKKRWFFCFGVLASYSGFLLIQVIIGIPGIEGILCCPDVFEHVPGMTNADGTPQTNTTLTVMDTAHSKFFIMKLLSYLMEVICGMSLLTSHGSIWYYCSERHIDLDDELDYAGAGQDQGKRPET
jgi:hypothetical protein